jgi:hypothetical protein
MNGGEKNAYIILMGRSLEEGPHGKGINIWENNNNLDIRKMDCEDWLWTELAQNRVQ